MKASVLVSLSDVGWCWSTSAPWKLIRNKGLVRNQSTRGLGLQFKLRLSNFHLSEEMSSGWWFISKLLPSKCYRTKIKSFYCKIYKSEICSLKENWACRQNLKPWWAIDYLTTSCRSPNLKNKTKQLRSLWTKSVNAQSAWTDESFTGRI